MTDTNLQLKQIVAVYLKKDPNQIDEQTSLKISSVLSHRMYADLLQNGFSVKDRHLIHRFGDLLRKAKHRKYSNSQSSNTPPDASSKKAKQPSIESPQERNMEPIFPGMTIQMGVDLEDLENFPAVDDFRQSAFYTSTFSQKEIAYCLLQEDPMQSFAGKFAAKEAIIKIDASYGEKSMNEIEILNHDNGKPYFKDFTLSISHTKHSAVAVALHHTMAMARIPMPIEDSNG